MSSRSILPLRQTSALVAAILALGFLAGCDRDGTGAEPPLTDDEFVAIMVELREADRELMGSDSADAAFSGRRAEILDRYETTEEEIEEFVRIVSRDLPRLTALWDRVSDELRQEGAAVEDPEGPTLEDPEGAAVQDST